MKRAIGIASTCILASLVAAFLVFDIVLGWMHIGPSVLYIVGAIIIVFGMIYASVEWTWKR